MNEAVFRYDEGSDKFEVMLRYVNTDLNVDRQFNFNRNVNEPINHFLRRLESNIQSLTIKKLKRKNKGKSINTDTMDNLLNNVENKRIKFVKDNSILDGNLTCKAILEDLSNVKLIIFDTEYKLIQNTPIVTNIKLPLCILVGFLTYPSKFVTMHVDKTISAFDWYKMETNKWIHVGEGYFYIPTASDVGCKLKLKCVPRKGDQTGPAIEIISNGKVEAGPGVCPFEIRHCFTKTKLSGKSFRVTSYNILANVYSLTDVSKDVLYPYCPEYALSMDYRKLLILKELRGYNADIICLQEVENKVFENDLLPALSILNYSGICNLKNDLQEGLAVFYNQDRFDQLNCSYSILSQGTDLSEFNITWLQIENENVKQAFLNRNTVIQAIALRSKENSEILVVGNTHLFFRSDADHIRLLQAYYGLMYLQKFSREIKKENLECNVSIVYCGDFNSAPYNGIYQLMTQKYIPEDYADWKSSPNEHIKNVTLQHNISFSSACGTPEYTNYTANFSGCLDYIFYQNDYLEVEQVIPMPSKEELSLHTGLPSVVFPSDHISLCADLKWLK
ncbi:2',5'-phosphodiesterase 12 [Dufourea novaeangliae]|uniref:2',5'-phosphodiesterase 12 n=2 Tax=Dufourea novaeangliae TaxID=178035 RepID=A0A154PPA1_DUFNO|nr:2',5'-phosphodiesterase 12 [Dufourea novaeangliae]